MKGDPKVIDYLNRALRGEMTAITQYWVHYRLQEAWGHAMLAKRLRAESIEEMSHADKLIQRILLLEGHPDLMALGAPRIGETLRETLSADLLSEMQAVSFYSEARDYCASVSDRVSADLFADLLADEAGHVDFIETQIALLDDSGPANYPKADAGPADEAR